MVCGWCVPPSIPLPPRFYKTQRTDNLTCLQGGEKYQQAFYVFEELAQAPATSSAQSLVSQAVAELHLGRTEEAQAALEQAMKKGSEYAADAIANQLVLNVISGKGAGEWLRYVPPPSSLHTW